MSGALTREAAQASLPPLRRALADQLDALDLGHLNVGAYTRRLREGRAGAAWIGEAARVAPHLFPPGASGTWAALSAFEGVAFGAPLASSGMMREPLPGGCPQPEPWMLRAAGHAVAAAAAGGCPRGTALLPLADVLREGRAPGGAGPGAIALGPPADASGGGGAT